MGAVCFSTSWWAARRNGFSASHGWVDTLQQLEVHERIVNKLARTFATQMEALRKHRNGGKQTVTVQHVNVEDGGQAIVGNVAHEGGGKDGK